MSTLVERLQRMLAEGGETALLRFSLGNALLATDPAQAARHFARAVALDAEYSAAWKLLGRAHAAAGDAAAARAAYTQGIVVAEHRGDLQAAKEMRVFLRRLERG